MENIRNERLGQIRNEILTEEFARKADEVFAGRRSHDFLRSIGFLLHDMGNLYTSLRSNPSEKKEERKAEHSIEEMAKLVLLFYKDLDQEIYDRIANIVNNSVKVPFKNGSVPVQKIPQLMQTIFEQQNYGVRNFIFYTKDLLDPKVADTCSSSVGIRDLNKNGERVCCRDCVLNIEDTIRGYYAIAHEFAHLSSQRVVEMKGAKTDCVGEIESLFMEKLFNQYMIDWGMITDEEYTAYLTQRRETLRGELSKMLEEDDLLSVIKPPVTLESLTEAEEVFRTDPRFAKNYENLMCRLEETVNTKRSAAYIFRYVVGEIVSNALFDDYMKDPAATMEKYKAFLFSNADKSYGELMTGLLGEGYEDKLRCSAMRMVEDCIEADKQHE